MLNGILKGLFQWLYGMFLDLISYAANALLSIMNTDLTYFETNVPIFKSMFPIMISIGWGLLLGNCAFQALKAMASGLGFEGESPAVLLIRTGIFGFLLCFSRPICDIGLGLGKSIMTMIGMPGKITLKFPTDNSFTGLDSSWILVIILGIILGFQIIKLFFEIAERYAILAVLTLCTPLGIAMGGSKATKDIWIGFMRTFASMILMMIMNLVCLKLILSALSVMPSGAMILPWCLLIVGIARVARKIDNLISKVGLNPAITGDPLGRGGPMMAATMAARTIISSAAKGGKGSFGGKAAGDTVNNAGQTYAYTAASSQSGFNADTTVQTGGTSATGNTSSTQSQRTDQSTRFGGSNTTAANTSQQTSRFGSSAYASANMQASGSASANTAVNAQNLSSGQYSQGASNVHFGGGTTVNTNRFGAVHTASKPASPAAADAAKAKPPVPSTGKPAAGNGTPAIRTSAKGSPGNQTVQAVKPPASSTDTKALQGKQPQATTSQSPGKAATPGKDGQAAKRSMPAPDFKHNAKAPVAQAPKAESGFRQSIKTPPQNIPRPASSAAGKPAAFDSPSEETSAPPDAAKEGKEDE